MSNNIDFISSIRVEHDFEHVVRMLAKFIYDAEAYLVGGPYDGGLDLIYKINGREKKESVQISIQKSGIEDKIMDDVSKVKRLVDDHGYPERLTFFWNQTMSNTKRIGIQRAARQKFGIEVEIYDATQIEQIATLDCPAILDFILHDIHKIERNVGAQSDVKARTFYDYLALSKDAMALKTSIIDAQILSSLFGVEKTNEELIAEFADLKIKAGPIESRIDYLVRNGRLLKGVHGLLLSEKETQRIHNIVNKDELQRSELLSELKSLTIKEVGVDLSDKALLLIKKVYRASVDIQISELAFEPPKIMLAKNIILELESMLVSTKRMPSREANEVAKKMIEVASKNEYLSNYCSSLLCVNLLNQRKLEKYIEEKNFFIYLDATVFIKYLALFNFKRESSQDKEAKIVAGLKNVLSNLKNKSVRITREYLEETIRHITQAEKISSFANDKLIEKFGDSKNFFFNLYLKERQHKNLKYSFDKFLDDLIGYERSVDYRGSNFSAYLMCTQRFLTMAGIVVVDAGDTSDLEENTASKRILAEYDSRNQSHGKSRKFRTAMNDLIACHILADSHRHIDKYKVGHIPIMITWDSTQHDLRSLYCETYPYSEWIIYTPQRAIERFAMLEFKMHSDILKDSVLAIFDEDYMREGSLIDTLGFLLGSDKIESDAIISILTKLSSKTNDESSESGDFERDEKNTINEALIHLQNFFRNRFPDVRKLFINPANENALISLLNEFVAGKSNKEKLTDRIELMLDENQSKELPV